MDEKVIDPKLLSPRKVRAHKFKERRDAAILEIQTNPGMYTPEKVQEWKELGLAQPDWVPDKEWNASDELNTRQMLICRLSALLMAPAEVSEMTGFSPSYISKVISSPQGKLEVERIQDKFLTNAKKMIEEITPIAVQTAFSAMTNPSTKAQTRVDAAFRFMDRAMGRPVQQIEMNDNLIRSVFEKLDSQNVIDISQKRNEATIIKESLEQAEIVETKELDPIDSWVKENL